MENIRIQDDLYNFVNQEWIEQAVIPDDKPVTGGFADLGVGVEKLLIADLTEMVEKGEYPNEYVRRACAIFSAAKDVKRRNREGAKPTFKTLAKIYKLKNVSAFNRNLKEFVLSGIPLPFDLGVMEDMKDTNVHAIYLQGPTTILPDVTYYKEAMAQQGQAMLSMWKGMALEVLKSTKLSEEEQVKFVEDTIKFDAIIATLVKSSEEWSEYTKCYNPTKLSKVQSSLKPIKFKKLILDIFGEGVEKIIVADPRWLKECKVLFNEENFELYKHWAYVKEILGSTGVLSEKLRDLGSSFRRAITGVKSIPVVEKFAYNMAGHYFADPIGLYYGEKYFGEEAKKDVVDMVKQIIETYKERMSKNDFLSEETKAKAISKLSKIKIKMGYPDSVDKKYDAYVFDETQSLYQISAEIERIKRIQNFEKLGKKVDKSEWAMPGHMVNACYNPTSNDITFPAAILQAPFYSIKQSRSQNLGGIGAVIGHEISHAFDNNGANCDEDGNLNNWWTKEDLKKFQAKTKAMVKEFEGIELPWGKVNSKLIVSENIADNGGMGVTLNIMNKMKDANYEEYFINWAKVWCQKAKDEYRALLLNVDVHAPAILRANMQVRNFKEWYETFKVTKKDKMFLPESKRVTIW